MKKLIAALAAVIVAALLFTSCTININGFSMYDVYANADKYTAGSFEYGRDEIKKVVIDWVSGGVEVNEEEGETLKVGEDSESLDEEKRVHHYIENGVLRIKFCASGYNGTFTPDEIETNKNIRVELPDGIDVEINTVSAAVRLYTAHQYIGLEDNTAKPLSVKIATTSGKVETGRFECGKATVTSVSGEIKIGSLICDDGKIETVSGTVNVLGIFKTLTAKSVSGEIKSGTLICDEGKIETVSGAVNVLGSFKTLTAKSISGDITVAGAAERSADFESASGDVEVKGNFSAINAKSISGAVDVGATFDKATVSTASGNVTITEFSGTLEFNTTSGKLKTEIPHTEDGDKYTFGESEAKAKVSTVSGNLTIGK